MDHTKSSRETLLNNKAQMSKSIVERPPAYRGPSKIPRFAHARQPLPGIEMENVNNSGRRPSKLMQLKTDYQDRIMREKEEKMVRLYEDNQKRTLERVNSKGVVRDFFRERHEIERGNGIATQIPTINQHFKQKRNEQKYGETDFFEKRKVPGEKVKRGGYGNRNAIGRDKANPLAPIDRNNTTPPITRKPQIHGRPWTKEDKKPKANDESVPKSAPAPYGMNSGVELYGPVTQSPSDDTPPPNLSQLKKLQKQKIKTNRSNMSPSTQRSKMSDFQKWQVEQDESRSERLKKHSRMQNDSDEENFHEGDEDEILSKQQELMEKIQRQKDELERMRREREKEEEMEKKEMEKRKRREEERRKKAKEDAERKRKEDEEQRRQEEDEITVQARKRRDEEAQRRLEAESRMMTNRTNRTHKSDVSYRDTYRDNMDDDFVRSDSRHRVAPTPPKHPKPVKVKRPSGNPKSTQPHYEREETPPKDFKVDISMYADAANVDGAYESSRVKLVPCSKCGRKFAADRVQRHMNSCDNLTKKRKILDPTKLRTAGTDMEKYVKNPKMRSKTPPKKKANWRKQHESFIENLRYAKKVSEMEKTGQDMSSLPPPPVTENPDYVQCPNCKRSFNPTTAERHIPRCNGAPRKK
ncbi:zinc finger C2HC domain-containing protein 1C-like isoform X2 [Mytilus californianus]|uniref:zinc finger C2HC domain-containing protein 1C-like isoform X2 n=1 Tax=Mytilus californianus TaxID=6549 RepID=UPI00224505F1|nr:zinc finger C2HC domain-containing protein 1C-like isoform X2 [Mytilus californianus]